MKYRVFQVTVNDGGRSQVVLKRIAPDVQDEETFGEIITLFTRNGAYWYLQLGLTVEFSVEVTNANDGK